MVAELARLAGGLGRVPLHNCSLREMVLAAILISERSLENGKVLPTGSCLLSLSACSYLRDTSSSNMSLGLFLTVIALTRGGAGRTPYAQPPSRPPPVWRRESPVSPPRPSYSDGAGSEEATAQRHVSRRRARTVVSATSVFVLEDQVSANHAGTRAAAAVQAHIAHLSLPQSLT